MPEPYRIVFQSAKLGDLPQILAEIEWVKELLRQGAKNFAIPGIADPKVAKHLEQTAKVGDHVAVKIGGWASEHSSEPAEVSGTIEFIGRPTYTLVGPMGKGARVQDGLVVSLNLGNNNHVVISERMRGANDSAGFTAVGIDVDKLQIIVLKDRVHHRAFWDTVAKHDIRVDAPGIGTADLTTLHYNNVPNHVYPIGAEWKKS